MTGYKTIREASEKNHIGKSPAWIRAGIRLGLIRAERIGHMDIISDSEIKRVKANPPIISRKEMFG